MLIQITIPQPKAKRLQGTGQLTVLGENGWGGRELLCRQAVSPDTTEITLDVPDRFRQHFVASLLDGWELRSWVLYRNESGSREERHTCGISLQADLSESEP